MKIVHTLPLFHLYASCIHVLIQIALGPPYTGHWNGAGIAPGPGRVRTGTFKIGKLRAVSDGM